MSDKVTRLPVRLKSDRLITLAEAPRACPHNHVVVDDEINELECSDCHAKLNPIQFIARLAMDLRSWDWQSAALAKARSELEARKRCRCTKCGKWTEIRTVHKRELARIHGGK